MVGGIAAMNEEADVGLEIPDPKCPVQRGRNHALAVCRHGARGHGVGVAFQGGERAPSLEVPDRERPEISP